MSGFEDFYRAEYPRVYKAALLTSGDREIALDATQEAFKRAFARWRRLRREQWAGAWVMTTALNECKRSRRLTARQGLKPVDDPRSESDLGASVDADRVDLMVALRQLPVRQRQAVCLYYLADLPLPAIAEAMSLSEGTVKAHLAQARRKLRDVLEVADV